MSTPNESPKHSENDSEKNTGGMSSRILYGIYAAVFVALGIHLLLYWSQDEAAEISYSTFLDYVEAGYVERIDVVNDRRVEGRYTQSAVADSVVTLAVDVPSENALRDADAEARRFLTTKPEDHDLTDFLRAYNADAPTQEARVEFTARTEQSWLDSTLFWVLLFGIILVVWVLLFRRMSPGSQMLNIGKSKAKLFDASENHSVTFDDVAGLDEAKEEVAEVVHFLRDPERFTRLGGTLPKGVMLVGPPGTGKTLMAKAVAGEAGVPFFSISGSDFVEMFVGVGASRVRDLFKSAKEKAPCIIFIDEMDAVGRTRGGNNMPGGNDERENTLNQLLVEMDGFDSDQGVIIIAATNRPDVLDSALLRPGRFDRQIMVDKPDRHARAEIFAVHVTSLLLSDDVDVDVLARQTPGFAGAEIANVCNEAALLAARKEKDAVEMDDFTQAIDRVVAGLEKKNKIIAPEERKVIAFHEAGHAIAGWFLEHTDPVVKVSIVPRGLSALGYAQHLPEERYLYSRNALLDRMTMTIGGRVAEEVVFGDVTTGAQNDLERITKMAYAMVVDYGMSAKVGQVSFNQSGERDSPVFQRPYAESTAEMVDEEVRALIAEVHDRAHALLTRKRALLDTMAEALLDREVLGPSELVELLGERPHGRYVPTQGEGDTTPEAPAEPRPGMPPSAS
jgi:cell division protease FtsH